MKIVPDVLCHVSVIGAFKGQYWRTYIYQGAILEGMHLSSKLNFVLVSGLRSFDIFFSLSFLILSNCVLLCIFYIDSILYFFLVEVTTLCLNGW